MFKVVVVEDEELLRMGLTGFFDWKEYGFELVGEAGNGLKGLEVIREKKPDLVITDIKMPHMDGIEMTEKLVAEMPDLMVLIISGYDDFDYAKRAIKAGVAEYILKPIKMENLKEAVSQVQRKLSEREKSRQEMEKLRKRHARNEGFKLSSLFSRLLIGQGEASDLLGELEEEERAILEGNSFQAGLICLRNFSFLYMDCDYAALAEQDQALQSQLEACRRSALTEEENACVTLLRTTHGERICCIMGPSPEKVYEILDKLKAAILDLSRSSGGMDTFFGNAGVGLLSLTASYKQARELYEKNFMRSWEEATGNETGTGLASLLNYDLADLFYEIKNGSSEGVHRAIQDFRGALDEAKITSYLQTILLIGNIYSQLVLLPEEIGGNTEEISQELKPYYQKLLRPMKRDELLEEMEEMCLRIQAYFQQHFLSRKDEVIARTDAFLRENYTKADLSMKDAAAYAYVSVSYLGMIIKRETGKTFTEYLTHIRLERAKQLLRESNLKNYEIAEACGYATPAYFSTVFKSSTGLTPSQYRAKKGQG